MKLLILFTLIIFSSSAFCQGDEVTEASNGLFKGLKETEVGKRVKSIAQKQLYQMIDKDLVGKSVYALAIVTQKFRYKKDDYILDLNFKDVSLSLGVNYDY